VWTIWIATIAFIGAGFVGWGSYQFGANSGKVAKVGDITIDKSRFDFAYRTIYDNYNQQLQGQLDEKKAKELKIQEQAIAMVESQAKLLNLAKHYGIQVSEAEIAQALQAMEGFQTNGKFDKKLYEQQLLNIKLKPTAYDAMLKDEIIVTKLMSLLRTAPTSFENDTIASAFLAENNIKYKVLTLKDVKIDTNDKILNEYWVKNKNKFKHPTQYQIEILWTPLDMSGVNDTDIAAIYKANSYKYVDNSGKPIPIEVIRPMLAKEIAIEKTKKIAQKAYIDFKNDKIKASENRTLIEINQAIPSEILSELKSSKSGNIIKPKIFEDKYAIIKLIKTIEPKVKNFDEAKNNIITAYSNEKSKNELKILAQNTLANISKSTGVDIKKVSLRNIVNLNGLNDQESLQFLQKLFTSTEENGIIIIDNKVVVYSILSKGILARNDEESKMVYKNSSELKKSIFEANLLKSLNERYITKNY
jgi:peptidyl-prolyl cis-trans isomerase D